VNLKNYILLFSIALIAFSCTKETIDDPVPDHAPVFTATGSFNGNSFELIAGDNGSTMQTMTRIENGVKLYTGILGSAEESIEFGIHEGNIDLSNISDPSSFSGALQFAKVPTEPLIILSKDLLPNALMIQEIKWYINGVFSGIDNVEILFPGRYNICAEVTFNDGMQSTLCNEMIAGYQINAGYKLRHYLNQVGGLKVWLDEVTAGIASVEWFVDDVPHCENQLLELSIGQKPVKVTSRVVFNNGVVRTRSILVDGSLSGKFIEDFSIFENDVLNPVLWDYSVLVKYTKNGISYSTAEADHSNSAITVEEVNYYGLNSSGYQVFKCKATVNCQVIDPSNGEHLPLNFTTNFGIEIKE
jgi:hypothetical protein